MKQSTPVFWILAVAVLLPVGAYLLYFRPVAQKEVAIWQDLARRHRAAVGMQRTVAAVNDSGKKAEILRQAVSDFESKLPVSGQTDKVLEDIWRMAQSNSLQTRTVKTPAVVNAFGYREQTMELSLAGDFGGFYQFLLQLEDAKHVMRIKKIHLSKLNDRDGEMQADLTLSVYFQPTLGAL